MLYFLSLLAVVKKIVIKLIFKLKKLNKSKVYYMETNFNLENI